MTSQDILLQQTTKDRQTKNKSQDFTARHNQKMNSNLNMRAQFLNLTQLAPEEALKVKARQELFNSKPLFLNGVDPTNFIQTARSSQIKPYFSVYSGD